MKRSLLLKYCKFPPLSSLEVFNPSLCEVGDERAKSYWRFTFALSSDLDSQLFSLRLGFVSMSGHYVLAVCSSGLIFHSHFYSSRSHGD